jgi:endonuclease/exonuclease/phosphatase family metal-dependent hydrolase
MQNYVQQSMIRTRIEAVSEEFEDIFVLGDMNDIPGMDEPEKELGFDSISALYKGEKDPILWNPVRYYPGEGTFIYKGEAGVLDYIFVSKGLKKGKGVVYEKYSEHFHFFKTMILHNKDPRPDRMKNMELFLSDHAPVTIEVYSDLK